MLQVEIASLTSKIVWKKGNSSLQGQAEVLIPERAAEGLNRTAGSRGEKTGQDGVDTSETRTGGRSMIQQESANQ